MAYNTFEYHLSTFDNDTLEVEKFAGVVMAKNYISAMEKLTRYYSTDAIPIIDIYLQEIDIGAETGIIDYDIFKLDLAEDFEKYLTKKGN